MLESGSVVTQLGFGTPDQYRDAILDLARAFGTITATRGRSAIDELRPKARTEARPGSMSATKAAFEPIRIRSGSASF